MNEFKEILKYKFVSLNISLCLITTALAFLMFQFSAFSFVLYSNLFDIFGYHFTLIRRSKDIPEKVIVKSYRINQFMFDLVLLLIIGVQFDWIAAFGAWMMKLFGLQDVFYYLFLKEKLPLKWTWMKWTPLGWFKGDLTKNEIIIQAVIGTVISILILFLM